MNPKTFMRPHFRAGISITVPGSCQASCFCNASSSRLHWAKALGSRRLFKDFLTRFHRRRAFFARRFKEDMLRRFAVFCANRSATFLRERGSSLKYCLASSFSVVFRVVGLPLRG